MNSEERVKFYKSGEAQKILREFDFDTKEEMMIEAAILTAKRNNPDMELIAQADKIVAKILSDDPKIQTKSSKTVQERPKEEDIAKHIAKIEMMKIKKPGKFLHMKADLFPKSSNSFLYRILMGVIIFAVLTQVQKRYGKYSFEEAQAACKKQHKVLPLTVKDFMDSGYRLGRVGFWTANGRVMFPDLWQDFPPDPDSVGYKYICVDTNGKEDDEY